MTISEYQVEFANNQAVQRGVTDKVRFHFRNMLDTNFETGLGPWTDGGADAQRLQTSNAHQGSWAVELRDNSGASSSISWTNGVDLTGYDELEVTFWFRASSFETNEDFFVELSNGSSWQVIGRFVRGNTAPAS